MPFLTKQQLAELAEKYADNPDVVALLWDIKEHHILIHRFDQLVRSVPVAAGNFGVIVEAAKINLESHPIVQARKEREEKERRDRFGQDGDEA